MHRWSIYLRSFNFDVIHIAGKNNELPDALSRDPGAETFVDDGDALEDLLPPERHTNKQRRYFASMLATDLRECILQAQTNEPVDVSDAARFRQPAQTLQLIDGAFYVLEHGKQPRLFVPHSCRSNVIEYYHEDPFACHPGADETHRVIREGHFWPRMRSDTEIVVRTQPHTLQSTNVYEHHIVIPS